MINRTVRERLLASTIIAGALAAAAPAFAQEAGGTLPAPPTTPSGVQTTESTTPAPDSTGEIVVTGSLIRNPALVASAPVSVIGQEEVQLRASNTAEEVLRDLPGAVPSIGSAVNNGNGGQSFVDLRGLGTNRNLVLLDGIRLTPASLLGSVDLNDIPLALIARTESLTGGAATTYGADAVSGVVNFVTRQDFSGVEIDAGTRITGQGDGTYYHADITIGGNFDEGKGNAVLSIGYQHSDPVYQGDRNQSLFNVDSFSGRTGAGAGSGTTVPARFSIPGQGTLQINPATGALVNTFSLYNFNPYNIFQTPFIRFNVYGAAHYDISDSIQVYSRGLFSKNQVNTIIAPSGIFGVALQIPYSNPYLPAAARNQFCAANGLSTAQCNAAAVATNPSDPNFRSFNTTVSRRTPDIGPRVSQYTTQYFDYRAGMKFNITKSINLDISGGYGESTNTQQELGYLETSRARAAVWATNPTTCLTTNLPSGASSDPGCVPLNLFGDNGSISAAQAGYQQVTATNSVFTSLGQARALLTGDFGYTSPFASTPISFAAGAEYRKYTAAQTADQVSATAGQLGGAGGAVVPFRGAYDVVEGYGEVIAPLVSDKPFFQSLQVEGGYRYSHYKVEAAGNPSFNAKTWKAAGSWAPVEGIKFRGDYQHAVRAPSISELFTPVSTGLVSQTIDPCASFDTNNKRIQTLTPGSNLYNICLAQGATASTINSIQLPSANQANITTGGNVNLRPEKANSYTLGVVLNPRQFIPGFTLTVDYYHIKITNAITTPTIADLLQSCFGPAPYTSPPANAASSDCTAIRRNPSTGGLDGDPATTGGVFGVLTNAGTLATSGIDLSANYRRDLGIAKLNLSFFGNWTRSAKFQATPLSINRECVGYYSANCGGAGAPSTGQIGSLQPEFTWNQRTTLTFGSVDVSALWRHISSMKQEPLQQASTPGFIGTISGGSLNGKQVNFQKISAYNYIDLATRLGVGENVDLTLTVQNLFDKGPPLVGTGIGAQSFNSGNTYPSTYDSLGRVFAVGARLKF